MSNIGTYKNFSKSNPSLEKQEAPIEYNSPNHEEKKKMTTSQIVAVILCIMTALVIVGLITAIALTFGNTSANKESLNTNNKPAVDNKTRLIPYDPERPVGPLHPAPNPFANKTIGFNKITNNEPNIRLFSGLQNIKS